MSAPPFTVRIGTTPTIRVIVAPSISRGGAGSGGGELFTTNLLVAIEDDDRFGKWRNGDLIPAIGKTAVQVITEAVTKFLRPVFTSFVISGQPTEIEQGQTIPAGSKLFAWATTHADLVAVNSLLIRNVTQGIDYLTAQPNDGTQTYTLASAIPFTTLRSEVFRILGTNTNVIPEVFTRDFTVTSLLKIFYDSSATVPTNSAAVRGAANSRFTNAGSSFNLPTGTVNKIFWVGMPATLSLVSAFDLDALNAPLTSDYQAGLVTFNVNDAAGTPVAYKIYILQIAVQYATSHRHQFNIA